MVTSERSSKAGFTLTVAQEAVEPSVVKYLPELPVCEGKASTSAQLTLEPSVVRNLPALPV
jgi:hypothetical protein